MTTLWLIMTAGYGYYVGNIANMGATYGSLVGLVILFIWLNFTSVILVMGAEFIAFRRHETLFCNAAPARLSNGYHAYRVSPWGSFH